MRFNQHNGLKVLSTTLLRGELIPKVIFDACAIHTLERTMIQYKPRTLLFISLFIVLSST